MNKQILLLILLCVYIGCGSDKSESDLLNKKNPTGIYGNFSSVEKIQNINDLISNKDVFINKKVKVLLVFSLILLVFALTNKIGLGGSELFTYNMPEILKPLTKPFRASARFFWIAAPGL